MKGRRGKRTDKTAPALPGLVLDAGALQALERRHLRLLVDLRRTNDHGLPIRIPAAALAQAWRGGPRSAALARLLKQPCTVVELDERSAESVGEFIASLRPGEPSKPDVVGRARRTARARDTEPRLDQRSERHGALQSRRKLHSYALTAQAAVVIE